MLYYTFSQTEDERMTAIAQLIRDSVTEEEIQRLPLMTELYKDRVEILSLADKDEIHKIMNARIHGMGISEKDMLRDFSRRGEISCIRQGLVV